MAIEKKESWKCDTCGKQIENIEDGWIEWLSKEEPPIQYGLRLVHHRPASPIKTEYGCQYNEDEEYKNNKAIIQDLSLEECIGADGLMNLIELIYENQLPNEEILEMMKRLHIPKYEQARDYLQSAISQGIIEPNQREGCFSQEQLDEVCKWAEKIIQNDNY